MPTSPSDPPSNGTIAQRHKTIEGDAVRPASSATLEEGRRGLARFVALYNHERLHSTIGYITPNHSLAGRAKVIGAGCDRKFEEARAARAERRRDARQGKRSA